MATEEQPAETKFRRAFEELSGKAANTKEERARRRDFARRIVTNDDHCLDACLALNLPVEEALAGWLICFEESPAESEYRLGVHDLKVIRRFLLNRYAYGYVAAVDAKLAGRVKWWWLRKDRIIPRLGLSLLVGFAAVCSGSPFFEWLGGLRGAPAAVFAAVSLGVYWMLIYLDVRNRVTGQQPGVVQRTRRVFGIGLVWATLEVAAAGGMTMWMGWQFHWLQAAMVACPALVFAVLTQFFFTKAGSMAEPL